MAMFDTVKLSTVTLPNSGPYLQAYRNWIMALWLAGQEMYNWYTV